MAEDKDLLALDHQVCFALYAANRAVTACYRPLLAELGLTYPQYLVMLVLWEQDQAGEICCVSDLGRRLRLDSGTLTPLLKRMEASGLIERQRSNSDERVVTLPLTAQGRALREKAQAVPEQLVCGLGIEPERLAALRAELQLVLSRLDGLGSSD